MIKNIYTKILLVLVIFTGFVLMAPSINLAAIIAEKNTASSEKSIENIKITNPIISNTLRIKTISSSPLLAVASSLRSTNSSVVAIEYSSLSSNSPSSSQAKSSSNFIDLSSETSQNSAQVKPPLKIGVAAPNDNSGLDKWIPDSKLPLDYAYQYLVGGVDDGWQTWSVNATFPLEYAKKANTNNIVPVFTYYQMLQSSGNCNQCRESEKDLNNLNNAQLMKKYYADFTKLMKRLGSQSDNGVQGYGKEAIVHIEPDLSGFAQQAVMNNTDKCYGFCTGNWNNPVNLNASVTSSGNNDLKDLPNNYNGYNLALLHLRDLYAPNVRLAIHVSTWTTGKDIATDKSKLNEWGLGWAAGDFLRNSEKNPTPISISKFDYIFSDVADRDAGFYKYIQGVDSKWWDSTNQIFPNFNRWENYIDMINQLNHKPIVIWQIPLGNQVMLAENNTWNHFQDNRVQYFFEHIDELTKVGISGLLFGAGNAGSSYHYDNSFDAITSPKSICTLDGNNFSVQSCTTQQSINSDDDGGYFQIKSREFFTKYKK